MNINAIKTFAAAGLLVLVAACQKPSAEDPGTISLSVESLNFGNTAGSKAVTVTSNSDWTVTGAPDWVTVKPSSGTGDQSIHVTVSKNEADAGKRASEREATLTFSISSGTAVVTLPLTQSGEDAVMDVSCNPENPSFDYNGGEFTITVEYNLENLAVKSNVDWLTISEATKVTKATATRTYSAVVAANSTSSDRSATVTVSAGDSYASQEVTISVTEKARPAYAPLPGKEAALSGEFYVSSTKKVRFSPGNLYWNGAGFAFESDQRAGATSWDPEHISHFYWSTSAENAIAEEYVDNGADITTGTFFADALSSDWETLSLSEYTYFRERYCPLMVGDGYNRYVTIDGVSLAGFVIAPEGATAKVKSSYTAEEWAAAEKAGFLLFAPKGERHGTTISTVGRYGDYWGNAHNEYHHPSYFYFITDVQGGCGPSTETCDNGFCVRLVTVVE